MSVESNAVQEPDAGASVGPGTVLEGRYELLRLVGQGGMGLVYLASDRQTGAQVAVKVLTDDRPIPKAAARFEREAKAIARIDHDHVVRVDHVGHSPRGGLYYVMEYLEGEELAETLLREGPLPWLRIRHFALQICDALQAAHESGVVHRDLKLENCYRITRGDDDDFVKILDFGVAKLLGPPQESDRLTNTGATLGTPAYMAPELCRGKEIDHRVDVYALGVMLFEMLTGVLPFTGEGFLEVALQHMHEVPPPLSEHVPPANLPDGLQEVIDRALAKACEDRFPTMSAFARALREVGQPKPVEVSPFLREDGGLPVVGKGGTAPQLGAVVESAITGRTKVAPLAELAATDQDHDAVPDAVPRGRGAIVLALVGGVALVGAVAWALRSEPEPPTSRAAVPEPSASASVEPRAPEPAVVPAGPEVEASTSSGPVEAAASESGEEASPPSTSSEAEPRRPRGLDRKQIDAGLRRVQPMVRACAGDFTGGKRGDRVDVVLQVDRATGKVVSAKAKARGSTSAVEGCVEQALRRATFDPEGRGVQRIVRSVTL